jgi:hypothetical protein
MNTVGILLLAIATCFAAGTALWITLTQLDSQRRLQQRKASVLRAQVVTQLHAIRDSVVPRGRALEPLQKEIYEPLQFLWVQANLLEPEELHALNRCGSTLLALRHKQSVNQTQARLAHRVIDETCVILNRSEEAAREAARRLSMTRGLAKLLPGFVSIGMDRARRDRLDGREGDQVSDFPRALDAR